MTSSATPARAVDAGPATALVRVFQLFAALAVLVVLVQSITAGQLFPQGGPEGAHAAGAIVLRVVSGLAAVAAVVLWRQSRLGLGTTLLAVVVFAYGFLQAVWGGPYSLWIHVPGAMVMAAGVVWLLVVSLRAGRAAR